MMRRLTLLATLLASLLAATHALSCLEGEPNCVDCTGNYTGHRVRPHTSTHFLLTFA